MKFCDAQISDVTVDTDPCQGDVIGIIEVQLNSIDENHRPDLLGFNHSNVVLLPKRG